MQIEPDKIKEVNQEYEEKHNDQFDFLQNQLGSQGHDVEDLIKRISDFQVAIPSWALGTGGTRFGRFSIGGEPGNLYEKISDVGILHALNKSSDSISLHIPWDIPDDYNKVSEHASQRGIAFDSVNSNTFQDQADQKYSYKHGSLAHTDPAVRKQAVDHNIEVVKHGIGLHTNTLTVWLADGSNFPGQQHFRKALQRTRESLEAIYSEMPEDWKMLIEYKPFEPNFYSMVIPDWGTSCHLAEKVGDRAFTLVDLGHHLPNTNIEQVVATLILKDKLGGFHFNDSKYADDDLTVGCIKPYQLFLIFLELVDGMEEKGLSLSWMIDASHNTKDPLEDLLQSVESIKITYAKSLLVDRDILNEARESNDAVKTQEILQESYQTDVRSLLAEARKRQEGSLDPVATYRKLRLREALINERGARTQATGL